MRFRAILTLLLFAVIMSSCTALRPGRAQLEEAQQNEFFERFRKLEGRKFAGQQVFAAETMPSWADKELVMHVHEFHEDVVYIPFRVGENTSRTWMLFRKRNGQLRLRHDHRHPDGSSEELTLYGGYSAPGSNASKQIFPADEYTRNLPVNISDNGWIMEFDEDADTFSYMLTKDGELMFRADFDLTEEL